MLEYIPARRHPLFPKTVEFHSDSFSLGCGSDIATVAVIIGYFELFLLQSYVHPQVDGACFGRFSRLSAVVVQAWLRRQRMIQASLSTNQQQANIHNHKGRLPAGRGNASTVSRAALDHGHPDWPWSTVSAAPFISVIYAPRRVFMLTVTLASLSERLFVHRSLRKASAIYSRGYDAGDSDFVLTMHGPGRMHE